MTHGASDGPSVPEPTGADRETLDLIFRQPVSTHVTWSMVLSLFEALGRAEERDSDRFSFHVGGEELSILKPHTHTLTSPVLLELRRFLKEAGVVVRHGSQS